MAAKGRRNYVRAGGIKIDEQFMKMKTKKIWDDWMKKNIIYKKIWSVVLEGLGRVY